MNNPKSNSPIKYWDGEAGKRIARKIVDFYLKQSFKR